MTDSGETALQISWAIPLDGGAPIQNYRILVHELKSIEAPILGSKTNVLDASASMQEWLVVDTVSSQPSWLIDIRSFRSCCKYAVAVCARNTIGLSPPCEFSTPFSVAPAGNQGVRLVFDDDTSKTASGVDGLREFAVPLTGSSASLHGPVSKDALMDEGEINACIDQFLG
eukprot:gnl/MRDRNA2_/MRDRNA2_330918_c0_seq1.p1 gnl/MRDRNA2_/MRDRNA2_330918_c0~~gnl/MRDRNA2_/MRDRNA2_330918_c0_seq1.p1  ORF type:complete len:197 (+),score=25.19 gnl/MRDRNA2_/MRDRNA2_330918_c0_seq1:81-593(+)